MIHIINYGLSKLGSAQNKFTTLDAESVVAFETADHRNALILYAAQTQLRG
jgi:hypothetical protein